MTHSRRDLLIFSGATVAIGLPSVALAETFSSLFEQAKWKSFGVDDWSRYDPLERSQAGAQRRPYSEWHFQPGSSSVEKLFDLIAFAEAGSKGYDAVHHSAKRRPKPPTEMTVKEIFIWIKATPGQHHAIGRYQFIPSTLAHLVKRSKLSPSAQFTPHVQDRLGLILLEDAGLKKFNDGKLSLDRFMNNLARIWAGLPLKNGRSVYAGVAKNRATISREFFEAEMKKIFKS